MEIFDQEPIRPEEMDPVHEEGCMPPEIENEETAPSEKLEREESDAAEHPQMFTPPVPPVIPAQMPPFHPPAPPVQAKPVKKRKGVITSRTLIASALILALVAVSCVCTGALVSAAWQAKLDRVTDSFDARMEQMQDRLDAMSDGQVPGSSDMPVSTQPAGELLTPAQVYAKTVNSVLLVNSYEDSFGTGMTKYVRSTGTGFFISEDGYVLTNYHVIEDGVRVTVTTYSGEEYEAEVIGHDEANDIALLKVEGTGFPAAVLGSSDAMTVGDQVVVIGNPLGELTSTMTVGYISGKERAVTTDGNTINMIQTDAAINSGNSGGPMFNMLGQVVGITTAKFSGSSSSGASIEGIGFAIPIDDIRGVVSDLKEYGYVRSAYMGVTVTMQQTPPELQKHTGLVYGVYVSEVEQGGPAAQAGICPGDFILAVGGEKVNMMNDLTRILRDYEPDDVTTITVFRNGRELELTITLLERPRDLPLYATDPTTDPTIQPDTQPDNQSGLPNDGSYEEWEDYFAPFFGED